jgi:hypothetical protein
VSARQHGNRRLARWRASHIFSVALLATLAACGSTQAETAPPSELPHHHELHLPPVGQSVRVSFDGKAADIVLSTVPHEGASAPLTQLWKLAFPSEDAVPLHFDLVGSDGFHPGSRPRCARLLTGAEIATARIDVVTHDVSFDQGLDLPGCYRVKAVVSVEATR